VPGNRPCAVGVAGQDAEAGAVDEGLCANFG